MSEMPNTEESTLIARLREIARLTGSAETAKDATIAETTSEVAQTARRHLQIALALRNREARRSNKDNGPTIH